MPKQCPLLLTSEEDSAMVFVSNEVGEHSITTRDLDVNENTIIQFEVLSLFYHKYVKFYSNKTSAGLL